MKKILVLLTLLVLTISMCACSNTTKTIYDRYPDATVIKLNGDSATINGETIEEFDYTWCVDPTTVHDDVKNSPAEYYVGEKPETEASAYIDHELYYYPELDESLFTLVRYDDEQEFVYYYQDGVNNDYIFATLPNLNHGQVPTDMMHSAEEAAQNKVLHITSAGTYILEGTWNGQIYIDLGEEEDTFTDENAKVTIILNGVDITCTVTPGIIFDDLYECDNTWSEKETYPSTIDTTTAGANIIVADGTENTVTGQNIYRMLKTKYKDDNSTDTIKVQKKARKIDAALYSYVSMNIYGDEEGTGTLTVNSSFEGLDTELHLTFFGGNITINSQDDGINVNEDHVSVVSFLGGEITINAANGAEGDGIDSNGYVVIDGANLYINGVVSPDNSVDSEDGITLTSGTVTIDGTLYETDQKSLKEIDGENQGFGNFSGGRGPDNGGFNPNDENFDPGNLPEDFDSNNRPEGFEKGNFNGQTPPEGFDGQTPPNGFDGQRPERPDSMSSASQTDGSNNQNGKSVDSISSASQTKDSSN